MAIQWADLSRVDLLKGKMCIHCQKAVFDTALFEDEQLCSLLKNEPNSCLKIDFAQKNLTITYNRK